MYSQNFWEIVGKRWFLESLGLTGGFGKLEESFGVKPSGEELTLLGQKFVDWE